MIDKERVEAIDSAATTDDAPKVSATEARQTLFALAIAKGESVRSASKAAGVADATGYRWAGNFQVVDLANRYRKRIVRETIGRLAAMGAKAASRLAELIDSPDESVALKASIAALAEVRRIADATDGDLYRIALPVSQKPSNPLDFYLLLDVDMLNEVDDPDDEPLPEPPNTRHLSKADAAKAESSWREHYEAIERSNRTRREQKQKYLEEQRLIEAEVVAAELAQ